jgi:hypothetical protein
MTSCSDAVTVQTCHMTVSVIAQLPGQRVVRGGRLGRLEFHGRLGTGVGRHGHVVGGTAWGIRSVQPHTMDSSLMR